MKLSRKIIIIIATILVLLIGGGIGFAMNSPTVRAERQLNLGNKYLQEGKYQEAILAFQKVIEIEPKSIPARLGLGNAYIATEEFDKAETVLKEVIGIDPNNIPAREELFKVYVTEGNLEAAKSILEEIAALNPDIDLKQFNIDLELAKTLSASKASYDQGIKQMNEKNYLEAVASFQKVIKEDTDRYDNAQAKISECRMAFIEETLQKAKDVAANKDYKTALDLIEQILKVDSNNQEALKLKGEYENKLREEKNTVPITEEDNQTEDTSGEQSPNEPKSISITNAFINIKDPLENSVITIEGNGFGQQSPYNGDSEYILITDMNSDWNAGLIGCQVTLDVVKWENNKIIINGFTGAYGGVWTIEHGDNLKITVWNPQDLSLQSATWNLTIP